MKTELSQAAPIVLLTALALQSRSEGGTKAVSTESVIDECVKLGQKHGVPHSLWRPMDAARVADALTQLQAMGHAMYAQGKRWAFGPCPISVPNAIKQICARETHIQSGLMTPAPKGPTISRDRKRDTCQQLARLVHPEIASVLDAIVADELT